MSRDTTIHFLEEALKEVAEFTDETKEYYGGDALWGVINDLTTVEERKEIMEAFDKESWDLFLAGMTYEQAVTKVKEVIVQLKEEED